MRPLALKEAMTMGMECLAYPPGLFEAWFSLQAPHLTLVLVSGVCWDSMVSDRITTGYRSAKERRWAVAKNRCQARTLSSFSVSVKS